MNKGINININFSYIALLSVVFIVLKLLNVISWSWLWVLSPLWISFILFVVFSIVCIIIYNYNKRR